MGVRKDGSRKSKNDSKTLVGKHKQLYHRCIKRGHPAPLKDWVIFVDRRKWSYKSARGNDGSHLPKEMAAHIRRIN